MKGIAVQAKVDTDFDLARKYYAILFEINNIKLTETKINLVAFCAIKGTFSTPPVREEFINTFKVHKNTVYNIVAELQNQKILIKDKDKKIRVNPSLLIDFSESLLLQIKLNYEKKGSISDDNRSNE